MLIYYSQNTAIILFDSEITQNQYIKCRLRRILLLLYDILTVNQIYFVFQRIFCVAIFGLNGLCIEKNRIFYVSCLCCTSFLDPVLLYFLLLFPFFRTFIFDPFLLLIWEIHKYTLGNGFECDTDYWVQYRFITNR